MWALGDKIASSIVAQTAGIPTLPWSGSGWPLSVSDTTMLFYFNVPRLNGLTPFLFSGHIVDWAENNQKKKIINVPHDVYELGCIQDVEDGLKVRFATESLQAPVDLKCFYYLFLLCVFGMLIIDICALSGCREDWLPSNGEGLRRRWRKRHS